MFHAQCFDKMDHGWALGEGVPSDKNILRLLDQIMILTFFHQAKKIFYHRLHVDIL